MSDVAYTKVSDLMTPSVHTISRTATVSEAIAAMKEHNVSSLAVQRRDEADEFGVITITDIAKKVIAVDKSPDRFNVYEVMSKPVLTVPAEMNIKYAVKLLVQFGPSRAVVVDHQRAPVGIITMRDMIIGKATS
jgi:CBS domain-containing protein